MIHIAGGQLFRLRSKLRSIEIAWSNLEEVDMVSEETGRVST